MMIEAYKYKRALLIDCFRLARAQREMVNTFMPRDFEIVPNNSDLNVSTWIFFHPLRLFPPFFSSLFIYFWESSVPDLWLGFSYACTCKSIDRILPNLLQITRFSFSFWWIFVRLEELQSRRKFGQAQQFRY